MTDQSGGRQKPPPDDRTLLDPLNADELKALREARAKMQAAKGGAVAHQVVIGPDAGEDIGDAPTRAMPALPQFENTGATLDKITTAPLKSTSSPQAQPQPQPQPIQPSAPPAPSGRNTPLQPMSMTPTQPSHPSHPAHPPGPQAGQTGFGENTLLWMAPPKPPAQAVAVTTGEMQRQAGASPKRLLKAGAAGVIAVLIIVALYFALAKKERAVIDLHTNPPKASVKINGQQTKNVTPMKLNLVEGTWEIEITLEGYKPHVFSVNVEPGAQPSRRDIELEPISKAGLMTVGINVQPVSANITLDGETFPARRTVKVANIDPKAPHKIVIEAGGYLRIEQEIAADALKDTYNFLLQEDQANKPQ